MRLLAEERRRRILKRLAERESVRVQDLAQEFRVSGVTIRGDLDALAALGRIQRSHGGALRRLVATQDAPVAVKATLHHAEKARIGRAALRFVHAGETIILDSGTTTLELAREIRRRALRPLTVVTNALNIAQELSGLPELRVIMLGGMLRHVSQSFVGPLAEQALLSLNADRLFLGVDGLDLSAGLTTPDPLEAHLNAQMIRSAREVVVLADASKFGRRRLSRIAPLACVQAIVTDARPMGGYRRALKASRVEVVLA